MDIMDEVEEIEIKEVDLSNVLCKSFDSNDDEDDVIYSVESEKIEYKEYTKSLYNNEINNNPILNKDEEDMLFFILQNTSISKEKEDARSRLIKSNLRLVFKEAYNYKNKTSVPIEDLVNSGIEGLCIAIDKFDSSRNTRLSTYAVPWIKLMIFKLITNYNSDLYIPNHIVSMAVKYNKINDSDDDQKIMEDLNIDGKMLKNIKSAIQRSVSIDSLINGEDNITLKDVIPDENAISPESVIMSSETSSIVQKEVDKLDPLSSKIIKMRYLSEDKINLAEIGKMFNVTGEYIRQLELKAINILKLRMKNYSFEDFNA
jgi:RNA polymerase primary sigma factor